MNFGIAKQYDGQCNMRFDDTNPVTEETEYVDGIMEDVCWITSALDLPWVKGSKSSAEYAKKGGKLYDKPWRDQLLYTSDYFEDLHKMATELIKAGKAYVDSETPEEIKLHRGGFQNGVDVPAVDSKYRNRSVEENLKLFQEMTEGKYEEKTQLLRAKIDMQSPNMNLRDPPIYRILKAPHHRSGDKWKVYPIYDFAHGQSDCIEHITHSICTLEFENHNIL